MSKILPINVFGKLLAPLGLLRDVNWANVYHDTICESAWFSKKNVSLGRSAIGYQFAYILYRVLDDINPESILEFGSGQSTKIITQYAEYARAVHVVVENNEEWIGFIFKNNISGQTKLLHVPTEFKTYHGKKVRTYSDLSGVKDLSSNYQFIVIDGPEGWDMKKYSRIDVLDLIPDSLPNDFIILVDDTERKQERNMVKELEDKLKSCGIEYCGATYKGLKWCTIIVSKSFKYLCTL